MTVSDLYAAARAELDRRAESDQQLAEVIRKRNARTATFADTALYNERYSEMLGETLAKYVPELAEQGAKETVCEQLLRDEYDSINQLLAAVQLEMDKSLGIHLTPQRAPFPSERVRQIAHSLEDVTVSQKVIERRAKKSVPTVSKSFHDDYIKKNAGIRSKLGLKPTIIRYGSNCCAWCSEIAGKYRFGEQPKDIFRRHDNCDCVIIYDTQVLRGKKDAEGKRTRTWEEVNPADVIVEGFSPTVFSENEAAEMQNWLLQGLTNDSERDIMNSRGIRHIGFSGRIFQSVQQLLSGSSSAASNEYLENLPKLSKPDTIMRALRLTNPSKDAENCARCVPAYEMRRRGYDVFAAKAPKNWRDDNIGISDFRKVFLNMDWKECGINDKNEIESFLLDAGHGSRVEISLKTKRGLHLFVAENDNGIIRFIDPQKSLENVDFYFNYSRVGKTEFVRIDNLEPSALIKDCLEVTL